MPHNEESSVNKASQKGYQAVPPTPREADRQLCLGKCWPPKGKQIQTMQDAEELNIMKKKNYPCAEHTEANQNFHISSLSLHR